MEQAFQRMRDLDLQRCVIYFGFLAIFLFFGITLYDDGFLTSRNLTNIVLQTAPATIMAIGLVFALSAGEIDLSFGSVVAVAALSAAVAMQNGPMILGVAAGLGAGILIGAFNGALVAYLRPEEKFESLDALITQMDADSAQARSILAQ